MDLVKWHVHRYWRFGWVASGDPDSRRNSRDRVLPETAVAKERPTCLKRNHVVLLEATWCWLGHHHQGLAKDLRSPNA